MINWCPSGRKMSQADREKFIEIDKNFGPETLRENFKRRLETKLKLENLQDKITCSLGGDTSFDIYPAGWDKTYALKFFKDSDVWFIGDRCDEGGNDKALYDVLKNKNRSFKTTGPEKTKEIIQEIDKVLHL